MTRNLPHTEWGEFTRAFTQRHQGWLISVYVQKPFGERRYIVRDVRFHGITADRTAGREVVLITTDGKSHLAHLVPNPCRMFVREPAPGIDAAVSIIDASGSETTAELRSPMPVTAVDGYVPARS